MFCTGATGFDGVGFLLSRRAYQHWEEAGRMTRVLIEGRAMALRLPCQDGEEPLYKQGDGRTPTYMLLVGVYSSHQCENTR